MTGFDPRLERARAFERSFHDVLATAKEAFKWGIAYFNDEFPRVYDLNYLWVGEDAADIDARALADEAERIQGGAGLAHRKVSIDDPSCGARLWEGFRALEWVTERMVVMALTGDAPDPGPRAAAVRELDRDAHRRAHAPIIREMPYAHDEGIVQELLGRDDLVADAVEARYFGAEADGTVVSVCQLYRSGRVAAVEDVGTLTAFRRRGFSRAVVARAVEAALEPDCDLVFLVADDQDWPKDFYAHLGFEPLGFFYEFTIPGDVVYTNR